MDVSELKPSPAVKIARLLKILESTYGITVDLSCPINKLIKAHDDCAKYTSMVFETSNIGSDPEYGKALLIQECIRMFLSEIAPKRINRKSSENKGAK